MAVRIKKNHWPAFADLCSVNVASSVFRFIFIIFSKIFFSILTTKLNTCWKEKPGKDTVNPSIVPSYTQAFTHKHVDTLYAQTQILDTYPVISCHAWTNDSHQTAPRHTELNVKTCYVL